MSSIFSDRLCLERPGLVRVEHLAWRGSSPPPGDPDPMRRSPARWNGVPPWRAVEGRARRGGAVRAQARSGGGTGGRWGGGREREVTGPTAVGAWGEGFLEGRFFFSLDVNLFCFRSLQLIWEVWRKKKRGPKIKTRDFVRGISR